MGTRLELQTLLQTLIESEERVYYQASEETRMKYPAIEYHLDDAYASRASNRLYLHTWRYQLTVIDKNPDSPIRELVKELPMCEFARAFVADRLYHFVFNIYY